MQRHVIKRQIIELTVSNQTRGQQLQTEVSRVYRQRIVPLLDQICSELSSPNQIYRIERLEVDLDQINPDQLEQELVQRAHRALHQALAREINRQERSATERHLHTGSQLELLAFFLRTGSLPWWVEAGQPRLLNNALEVLIDSAPDTLRHLMRDLSQSATHLRRLVQTFDDELLSQLAVVLPATPTDMQADDIAAFIKLLTQTTQVPSNILRAQLWLNMLDLLTRAPELATRPGSLYQTVLTQLAVQSGITYPTLLAELERIMHTTTPLPERLKTAVSDLLTQAAVSSPTTLTDHIATLLAELERVHTATPLSEALKTAFRDLLTQAAVSSPTTLTDHIATLRTMAYRLPGPARRQLLAELNKLAHQSVVDNSLHKALQRIAALVHASLKPPLSEAERITIESMNVEEAAELIDHLQNIDQETVPPPEIFTASDLSFSETDEIYIHNAGLVILWPFLPRFFENLGLVSERRFDDEAAQHRAAGILQYMVHPETDFPEYLLPLNKLLCGLDLSSVFTFDATLTETEIEQCPALLEAVIAQAPILRQMTAAGFRGTFLLREGILSSRDGAWLLRVERESYDIVLDRFPWNWTWVKLPWMEVPLQVEW